MNIWNEKFIEVHMIFFREEKRFSLLENWKIIFLSSDSPQVTQIMVKNQYMPAFKILALDPDKQIWLWIMPYINFWHASFLTFIKFTVLFCKMEIVIPIIQGYCENYLSNKYILCAYHVWELSSLQRGVPLSWNLMI